MDAVAQRIPLAASRHAGALRLPRAHRADLPAAVQELAEMGAGSVNVVPMFLGAGRHVREDLPELMERLRTRFPDITLELQQPVGEDARLLDVLAEIAAGTGERRPLVPD
jgi:sirohydrochlorin cobaltochelatase